MSNTPAAQLARLKATYRHWHFKETKTGHAAYLLRSDLSVKRVEADTLSELEQQIIQYSTALYIP